MRTNTVDTWDDLSVELKHTLSTYVRTKSDMETWEEAQRPKPKRGRLRGHR